MLVTYLKTKIHKATITQTKLHYKGSIAIDAKLMEASNLLPNEKVAIFNYQNGNRFETFVIKGKKNSGIIGLNGPAALLGEVGQEIVIVSYAIMTPEESLKHKPWVIHVNRQNRLK